MFIEMHPIRSVKYINIKQPFYEVLTISFKAAIIQKRGTFLEESKDTIKRFENMMNKLFNDISSSTDSNYVDVLTLATSYCNMAIMYKDDTTKKKLLLAKSHLNKSLKLLEGKEMDRKIILIIMRVFLQLKYIYHKLNEQENCYLISYKALDLYYAYTKYEDELAVPITILSNSLDIEKGKEDTNTVLSLSILHTEFLKHAYDVFISENIERNVYDFVKIMHNFLMHRLTMVMADPLKDTVQWINGSLQLSSYFIRQSRFTEARDCIAAAQYILNMYYNELKMVIIEDNHTFENFHYLHCYNMQRNVATCWINYDKTLLFLSKYNLLYDTSKMHKMNKLKLMSSIKSKDPAELLIFTTLKENLKNITDQIVDTCVSDIKNAKAVFVHCAKWFDIAKTCLENEQVRYEKLSTELTYSMSEVYKYLAYFEPDKNKEIKLRKRQIQMLISICDIHSANDKFSFLPATAYLDLAVTYAILLDIEKANNEWRTENMDLCGYEYVQNSVKCYKKYITKLQNLK